MRSGAAAAAPKPSGSAAALGGLSASTGLQGSELKMLVQRQSDDKMPAQQVDRLLCEFGARVATPAYEFRMPLHYPRYSKADYESMPEWKLDCLLADYGLPVSGDLHQKRNFAMGAFLWPS